MSVDIALVELEETSTTLAFLGNTHWFGESAKSQPAITRRTKEKKKEEISG